ENGKRNGQRRRLIAWCTNEPVNSLLPEIPGGNRRKQEDNRGDHDAPRAEPGIVAPVDEEQFGHLDGQDDGPYTLVAERVKQVNPIGSKRPTVDVERICGDEKRRQGSLERQTFQGNREGETHEEDGGPPATPVASCGTNDERAAPIYTDLRKEEI